MTAEREALEPFREPKAYAHKNGQFAGRIMFELAAQGRLHENARLIHICEAVMRAQEFVATHDLNGKLIDVATTRVDDDAEWLIGLLNNPQVQQHRAITLQPQIRDRLERIANRLALSRDE